jgi:hypothetical protein
VAYNRATQPFVLFTMPFKPKWFFLKMPLNRRSTWSTEGSLRPNGRRRRLPPSFQSNMATDLFVEPFELTDLGILNKVIVEPIVYKVPAKFTKETICYVQCDVGDLFRLESNKLNLEMEFDDYKLMTRVTALIQNYHVFSVYDLSTAQAEGCWKIYMTIASVTDISLRLEIEELLDSWDETCKVELITK